MKIYEAADLAPDTYAGEYFQPSVKVYKKEDVDEEIIKKCRIEIFFVEIQ